MLANMKNKKIGLTLGGGATKAFATFAVLEELQKNNISIDLVSGASAGALVGAYFALFGEVESLRKELDGFSRRTWFNFADFAIGKTKSLINGRVYREYLERKFGDRTFKDTKIPLFVAVTDIISGKVEYLNKGRIVDALIASSAYPGIFPPFQKGNAVYVDGGVLDNLPCEILFKNGADKVIAVNLGVISNENHEYNNLIAVVARSLDLMMDSAFRRVYEENERLFVFDVKFKPGFASTWNITNLDKKFVVGRNEFEKRKEEFLKWYLA